VAVTDSPSTFSELLADLQARVRSETGTTAVDNIAKRFLNIGLRSIHIRNGDALPWAEDDAILQTRAPYTAGLVTIAQGSTTLTGVADADAVSPAWSTADAFSIANARAGGKVTIGGGRDSYQVASVTSDTSLELTTAFIGTTIDGTTQTDDGASYQYYEDTYDLDGDFLRPLDQRHFDPDSEISLYGIREFRRRFGRNTAPGTPRVATILHKNTTSGATLTPTITLHPPPSATKRITYSFVTRKLVLASDGTRQENMSADDDEPVMPVQYRYIIVLNALFHWYRDRKDDARADSAGAEYDSALSAMLSDNEIGSTRPHIAPNVSTYARRAQRPWGGGGRGRSRTRYDLDDRFDRFED